MAEDRSDPRGEAGRPRFWFPELFKSFQVAIDPKKLVLAAAGVLLLWLGWWAIAVAFYAVRTEPQPDNSANVAADLVRYQQFLRLAGPGTADPEAPAWKRHPGLFRTAPWDEDRGPNPYLLATGQLGRPWGQGRMVEWLFAEQVPLVLEPVRKFLTPVVLLFHAETDAWTRVYLLATTLWSLVVWGFFGGAITRLAVCQFAGVDRTNLLDTLRFVLSRYGSYLAAPLVPLAFIGIITLLTIVYGFFHLIPAVGDVLDAALWPLILFAGFAMALLVVGLLGFPLMYATVSAEGSDTFEAVSRSFRYVFESPWNFLWYALVSVAYGVVVIFFVGFMGSFAVYLAKWGVAQTPFAAAADRSPEYLMIYAPTSLGWRELLTQGSEVATDRHGAFVQPAVAQEYLGKYYGWNHFGAGMVGFWLTLVLLAVVGFSYSYFFTASTMIYLLLRRKVDDTDLDEYYPDDEQFDEPLLPAMPSAGATPAPAAAKDGPIMVAAPTLRTKE